MFLAVNKKGSTVKTHTKKGSKKASKRTYASGIVYLIKMELDCGTTVIKIGVTGRKYIAERLAEVTLAFFQEFRYIPRTSVLKMTRCVDYYGAETALHHMYKECNYDFGCKFQGSTEYHIIEDEEKLKADYVEVLSKFQEKPSKKDERVIVMDTEGIEDFACTYDNDVY